MAPKRKATTAAKGARPSKRPSAPGTPISLESDEYTEEETAFMSEEETQQLNHLVQKFSHGSYHAGKRDAVSHLFKGGARDFGDLELKPDADQRPLWIDPNNRKMIVESFSPAYNKDAENFLVAIAEPQSRVSNIHEYSMTTHSLFAAVSLGITERDIVRQLEWLSKTVLPETLKRYIHDATKSFGKVRLVLKHTRYYLESSDPEALQTLLKDSVIASHRIDSSESLNKEKAPTMGELAIPGTKMAAGAKQAVNQQRQQADEEEEDADTSGQAEQMARTLLEEDEEDDARDEVHSFEIGVEYVQTVSKRCRALDLPLTEEYDFRNDEMNANLDIDLKPQTQIRYYQENALNKMFSNGRARSGIIVLPCGAGKTLVGITAACTVKKGIFILCTSEMSCVQWKDEFIKWSNINPKDIAVFTASAKEKFPGSTGVIISTYSMVTQSRKRSYDSNKVMEFIEGREWGLMILDEVHVAPADTFMKVTHKVKAHSKLGLTATLLREDDRIKDLNFLIGPKLYEANWQQLSDEGHIARVQCAEVWCPMTPEFYTEYLRSTTVPRRKLLFTMNPGKFQACQFLIDYHEKKGDKIIVFSDNVYSLKRYAQELNKAFIYGDTPQAERQKILENFRYNDQIMTIFLSKIGDTSLDLPEATCLIQISSHFGSRRQEAQRLGRILRAKRRADVGFNAFFYSLVSKDTMEVYYSSKRQAFLVDQGYAFKVITHLNGIEKLPELAFTTPKERRELLTDVMLQGEDAGESERIDGDLFSDPYAGKRKKTGVRRTAGTLGELSGGQDMAYMEYNRNNRNKELQKKGPQNAFLKKLKREQDRRKAQI